MGRAPCCDKASVKRGPWSPEEDATLKRFLETHGIGGNWIALPGKAGLKRCGKSCRLRWLNYLRPDIKHGDFTEQEDNIICSLYSEMGSRWSLIASQLPGRTDNDVKNYWNTKLKKKLLAGNTSLTSKSNGDIPTYNPTPLDSTPSLPCIPTAETYNYNFDYSTSQTQISAPSPLFTEVGYGLSVNDTQSLNLDPTHFCCPEIIHVSEFGVSAKNGHIGTSSQEGSSISDSTSYAMNNMCVSLPSNGGAEDAGILTDFGFGFPYDLVNGPYFQDKASEVAPSCYPNLSDFGYADINSQ